MDKNSVIEVVAIRATTTWRPIKIDRESGNIIGKHVIRLQKLTPKRKESDIKIEDSIATTI